ncbi:MAG TPA: hypothetical protein VLE19_10390, partial [Pyrinomonadaceae bacterium]|nr:hypothetical protein [Pyrinomonadaceae bacterium]
MRFNFMRAKEEISPELTKRTTLPLPPGPRGHFILGVMREFNNDTLGFIERCRDYGDVVRTRFLYVHAYFLYNPSDIET